MKRSLIAALAFSSVMSLSGLAMAQTMVGGAEVSAEDLPRVQAQCDALVTQAATADSQSVTSNNNTEESGQQTPETSNGANASETADPASTKADGADGTAAALTTSIDLDTLTLDQCKEAGLVK
jgi:hypothetical protein